MRKSVGLLACVSVLMTGCGTVAGQAEPGGSAIKEPAFSPCDDIPDAVVRGLGFDPATEAQDIAGVKQPGWNLCGWLSEAASLDVLSSRFGLDDVRQHPDYRGFRDVDISGQPGLEFDHVADDKGEICYTATEIPAGLVMVAVDFDMQDGDSCALAHAAAVEILPYTAK